MKIYNLFIRAQHILANNLFVGVIRKNHHRLSHLLIQDSFRYEETISRYQVFQSFHTIMNCSAIIEETFKVALSDLLYNYTGLHVVNEIFDIYGPMVTLLAQW